MGDEARLRFMTDLLLVSIEEDICAQACPSLPPGSVELGCCQT